LSYLQTGREKRDAVMVCIPTQAVQITGTRLPNEHAAATIKADKSNPGTYPY
jgi:hypothetical protein